MNDRELFLYELEGRGYEFENKTWIHGMGDVGGLFDDDQLNMIWEMWCASASREGYKLVPVEPTSNTLDKMWEALKGNAECMSCIKDSYKAMINSI